LGLVKVADGIIPEVPSATSNKGVEFEIGFEPSRKTFSLKTLIHRFQN
jgi:hypothetical protein